MQQLKVIKKDRENEEPRESVSTSSTSTDARDAGARVCARERDIDNLIDYARGAGMEDTPAVRALVVRYLRAGVEMGLLMAAMDDTMLAPRPSWRYWTAIVSRCMREGVTTLEGWMYRQERYAASRSPRKPEFPDELYL